MSSTAGSASSRRSASRVESPPTSADRSRPPTPRAERDPDAGVVEQASSCWQPVPDAATMPTGPGCTTLAKPSPMPPTTAVPQSGPITSSPRSAAPLERDLLLDRHVVAEDHHVAAGVEGVHRLDERVTRPGTDTSASARR